MTTEEQYELIERYLNKDLSQEEQSLFDLKVKNDPAFAKEVAAHIEANQILIDQGVINIGQKLRKIHEAEISGKNNSNWKLYLSGAALIALTSTAGYFYFSSPKTELTLNNETKPSAEKIIDSVSITKNDAVSIYEDKKNTTNIAGKENSKPTSVDGNHLIQDNQKVKDTVQIKPTVVINIPTPVVPKNDSTPAVRKGPEKIDCATVQITGDVNSSESCADKSNGNIIVNLGSLKGGSKPYKFSIDGHDEFKTGSQFYDLPAGFYKVTVKDRNNCESLLKEVEVKSKNCPKEYAFAPSRNEQFDFPMKANANGDIKITSRGGEVVYHATINNGYPNSWNGTNTNGTELTMGIYMFVITYSNGEINQGYVTVLK